MKKYMPAQNYYGKIMKNGVNKEGKESWWRRMWEKKTQRQIKEYIKQKKAAEGSSSVQRVVRDNGSERASSDR